ncbi:MAG: hypothetical protein N2043_01865 [Ignavibacterium sp.]|nr:hypothetical protein [Ignavibacterium sp.]
MNVFDCEYYSRCLNNSKCIRCGETKWLLKLPEDKARKTKQSKAKQTVKDKDGKTWRSFEQEMANKLNAVPTIKEYDARRQIASGAIEGLKGDITDPVVLAECKEYEVKTSKGEKNITIKKEWLDKIFYEAKQVGKYPALFYRYKNEKQVYIIQPEEVWLNMLHEIKLLRHEREYLKQENALLKKQIEKRGESFDYS